MSTSRITAAIRTSAGGLACIVTLAASAGAQRSASPAAVRGVVTDSLRGGVLSNAFVELVPGGRQVATNEYGEFEFRGVAPGSSYTLRVMHALLDTLGVGVESPPFRLDSTSREVNLSVPPPDRLVAMLCDSAWVQRGPAALVGFVHDPDTGVPLDTATVSLVYDESPVARVKLPVTRTTRTDAHGRYRICGLPVPMSANVLLTWNGLTTGDVPVTTSVDAPLSLRALGLSLAARSLVTESSEAEGTLRVMAGDAVLVGRVRNKSGLPVAGARVQMDGTLAMAITATDGSFRLDSVPAGSQIVSARKIGYGMAERAVEVRRYDSEPVVLVMEDFVPRLTPVVTVSQRVKDLESTGFARRRTQGFGFFLEGDQIDRGPPTLGEALRLVPGLRIGYDAQDMNRQKALIMNSRDSRGCVRYIVDGVYWQEVGGDIEEFVRPQELEAIEMYNPMTVPGEFAVAGRGRCSVLVLWTRHKIRPAAPAK